MWEISLRPTATGGATLWSRRGNPPEEKGRKADKPNKKSFVFFFKNEINTYCRKQKQKNSLRNSNNARTIEHLNPCNKFGFMF